jgi:hypothetical protein
MWGFLLSVISVVVGPAITGAVVAFVLNTRDERLRASRDFQTKFLEATRDDVREAVAAGVAYFVCSDKKKVSELEAQVLLFESEIRSGMTSVRSACTEDDFVNECKLLFLEADFLEALTGGTFGNSPHVPSPAQARKLVGQGSLLRSDLAKLRRGQLERARFKLPISKSALILGSLIFSSALGFGLGLYANLIWPAAKSAPETKPHAVGTSSPLPM